MNENKNKKNQELTEHLFRIEYGKIVSVITRYVGVDNLDIAEDIAQETFYKAIKYWQLRGIPSNPEAWLYITAKNECLNVLKRNKRQRSYIDDESILRIDFSEIEGLEFSDQIISDEQLRMMFACCDPSISSDAQLSLILKILCGFSISEIASAFHSTVETINKRLVRARKKLKSKKMSFAVDESFGDHVPTVLKAIYLLFNEGYSPAQKNKLIRKELCFEAIRLIELLKDNRNVEDKDDCHALLSLMYLNASRFDSRMNGMNEVVEMKDQDRSLWNKELINQGIIYLQKSLENGAVTVYHILAAISANHCTASDYEKTNWKDILDLYDSLLALVDSPLIRLNRSVALSKVEGNEVAIRELEELRAKSDIDDHYLFHSTIAEFHLQRSDQQRAAEHFHQAISLATNERDIHFLQKKLSNLVPI